MNQQQQGGDAPAAPKISIKHMLLFGLFMFRSRIKLDDEDSIYKLRIGLVSVVIVALSTFALLYFQITSKKDEKVIWVPPKQAKIPFLGNMLPAPKPEEYKKTTVQEQEIADLLEHVSQTVMIGIVAMIASIKFNIHFSCLMQCISVPFGLLELDLFKKHFLGKRIPNMYDAIDYDPATRAPAQTSSSTASARSTNNTSSAPSDDDDNFPRVEELDDEDEGIVKISQKQKKEKEAAAAASAASQAEVKEAKKETDKESVQTTNANEID